MLHQGFTKKLQIPPLILPTPPPCFLRAKKKSLLYDFLQATDEFPLHQQQLFAIDGRVRSLCGNSRVRNIHFRIRVFSQGKIPQVGTVHFLIFAGRQPWENSKTVFSVNKKFQKLLPSFQYYLVGHS